MVSSELVAVWITVFTLILVTHEDTCTGEEDCKVDDNQYNITITCSCTEAIFTDLPNCTSNIQNQTLATVYCNFTAEQCATTSGVNRSCSCDHNPPNTTLVHSTLECCSCPQHVETEFTLGCNFHSKTMTTTISNAQSQNDYVTGTTVTISTVAMTTNILPNTVPMTTTGSSLPTSTTPASSSILLPVVAGVLLPVCLLCTISVAAATLCIILHYRKHQTPQQSGTTHTLQTIENNTYTTVPTTAHPPPDDGLYSHIHRGDTTQQLPHPPPPTYSTLASTQAEGDGEAPPDYSMITLENMSPGATAATTDATAAAAGVGAVYSTVVRMDGKKTTVTLETSSAQTAASHVDTDPDYFDDPSLLQQIRAHKQ